MASINDLINAWEPQMQAAFLASVYKIRDQAQVDHIIRMLQRGDVEGALRAVGMDPAQFRPLDLAISGAFEAAGEATAAAVPAVTGSNGLRVIFQWNIRNPAAEDWLRSYSSTLVRQIIADQRDAIRNFLTAGLAQGANPKQTALDLVGTVNRATGRREGGVIGLTSSQEQWVRNYRDELTSDNPTAALSRALRDKRFDRAVLKAENDGVPIAPDLLEKMVTTYKNRALRYRGETIGRKETVTALHTAQEQAMQQAIAAGNVDKSAVSYVWHTARDPRVRDTHRPMEGQIRAMGTPFTTGAGVHLMYPGDPEGPPQEVINCRCHREPRVDFLKGIK